MKAMLLRKRPYKVVPASQNYAHIKIQLNPNCGLEAGDMIYQVRREDGVIELIPEKIFKEKKLHLKYL